MCCGVGCGVCRGVCLGEWCDNRRFLQSVNAAIHVGCTDLHCKIEQFTILITILIHVQIVDIIVDI